jgi:phosphatidylglycerophosphate synthase
VLTGALIISGDWFFAGWTLLASGLCDVFDGSVARHRGQQKRSGAFMDSVLDRVSDAILFSCLFWALAEDGRELDAALALFTLVGSLSVSHIRAEAEAVGVTLTEGLFQRLERFLALMIGLLVPGAMTPILVILAVLGAVTALQRGWSALVRA